MRSSRIPDSTELAILKANGALRFDTENGALWALFDDAGVRVGFDVGVVDSHSPQLTCRSLDIERLMIGKGARISRAGRDFVVRDSQPDGTGQTTLVLDEE